MARKSRLIYPGMTHHSIQRGNNRQEIFFEDGDRHYYLKWMLSLAIDNKVPIIGYCLMTNHLLLLPQTVTGLINFMKVLSQWVRGKVSKGVKSALDSFPFTL